MSYADRYGYDHSYFSSYYPNYSYSYYGSYYYDSYYYNSYYSPSYYYGSYYHGSYHYGSYLNLASQVDMQTEEGQSIMSSQSTYAFIALLLVSGAYAYVKFRNKQLRGGAYQQPQVVDTFPVEMS